MTPPEPTSIGPDEAGAFLAEHQGLDRRNTSVSNPALLQGHFGLATLTSGSVGAQGSLG